jgi:hypothetical protein
VLNIVEYQQELGVAQLALETHESVSLGRANADGAGDRREQEIGSRHRSQRHGDDTPVEVGLDRLGHRERDPGLPDAARSRDRDEANSLGADELPELRNLALSTDQT